MKQLLGRFGRFVKRNLKIILIGLGLIILVVSQVRTFVQDGEILGFEVVERSRKANGIGPAKVKDETKNSLVCKTIDEKFVSDLVGKEVTKGTITADIDKDDRYLSSCIYRTDAKAKQKDMRVVSASYQERESVEKAQAELNRVKERNSSEIKTVEGVGEQAFFDEKRAQLVVRSDKKVVSVYVNSGDKEAVNEQDIATKIAQKLLQ